jgi:hypothetical protein
MGELSDELTALVHERRGIEFRDRESYVASAVRQKKEEFSARGMLRSGMAIEAVRKILELEYEVRAQITWLIWARALSAKRVRITDGLAAALKEELSASLSHTCSDLPEQYSDMLRIAPGLGSFSASQMDEARERAFVKVSSEIDFALMEAASIPTSNDDEPAASPTFNVYSPVGAIQTGSGASATVHMGMDADTKQTLADALASVAAALESHSQITADVRTELLDVVADARTELEKPKPNAMRLRGAVSTVGTTIRTIGSLPGAYRALKTAGTLIGVSLP